MPNQEEEIKKRLLGGQGEAQPVQPQAAPAAPAVPATPTPAPAEPPVPAEPAPPAVNPEIQAEIDRLKLENAELAQKAKEREASLRAYEIERKAKLELPSVEELDGMSQGEALHKFHDAMTAQVKSEFSKAETDLHKRVIDPMQRDAQEVRAAAAERQVEAAYPGTLAKYGRALREELARYPEMDPVRLLKGIADPRDLAAASRGGAPTTPAPTGQPGPAVPFESGVSARAGAAPAPQTGQGGPTVADHMQASQEAKLAGDYETANTQRLAAVRKRLADAKVLPPG